MVIDFRVQPPYRSLLNMHFYRPRPEVDDPVHGNPFAGGRETPPSFTELSLDLFLDEMTDAGIDRSVIVGQRAAEIWGNTSNSDIADLVTSHPTKFVGFGGVDASADDPLADTHDAIEALGLTGIALLPGWGDPPIQDDAEVLMPVYEYCSSNGIPVIVTSSHFIGPDMLHAHPVHLQHVAMSFPDLTLIVGHAGWPWTMAAIALAMRCHNVYLMPEFYMYLPHMPGAQDYVDAANGFLKHRMLYSSCYPSNSLANALSHFRALPLTEDAQEHLLWRNAERLLDSVTR